MSKHQEENIPLLKKIGRDRITCLLVILFFVSTNLPAQEVIIKSNGLPLNQVLVEIRENYDLNFSFDDQFLSQFTISIDQSFSNPDKALSFLLSNLPVSYEKVDDVYVIYPSSLTTESEKIENKRVFGVITDGLSGETLPYSHVMLEENGLVSDAQGRFVFNTLADSSFNLRVSHLGYRRLDTIVLKAGLHQLHLIPDVVGLKEVVVKNKAAHLPVMSPQNTGEIRLNHKVGSFLPGFADNSLYNLLRLQPGVLAAGEQANDLIIWGSYSGQTGILFDGFTLYGLKNFNDNIGIVNPFMVQDIKLLKGAYPANYGGKAGGIVDITGRDGSRSKPDVWVSATNLILNAKLSVPINNKSSFSIAYRRTYYNIYNKESYNSIFRRGGKNSHIDSVSVFPNYRFNDLTAKFAGQTKGGDRYYIDFLRGTDSYNYNAGYDVGNRKFETVRDERNLQIGGSLYYGKTWRNGNTSDLLVTGSSLSQIALYNTEYTTRGGMMERWRAESLNNQIEELTINQTNHFSLNQKHSLELGVGLKAYKISYKEDSLSFNLYDELRQTLALATFVQDQISITENLNAKIGLRVDLPFSLNQALVQPRLSMNYQISDKIWLNGAWGIYKQYVVQSSLLEETGNYRFFWTLSDDDKIPIQSSNHFAAGINYAGQWFSIGVESYYKKMEGLTRYITKQGVVNQKAFLGEGKSMGIDLAFEGQVSSHRVLLGYTLSRTVENFGYLPDRVFIRSPHDQTHEIKTAVILDFNPFFISTNYVYGSGFPKRFVYKIVGSDENLRYSRWDISGTYKFSLGKINLQAGLSVLNLMNTKNIKYQDFVQAPSDESISFKISAEAVPFTPTIFLIARF